MDAQMYESGMRHGWGFHGARQMSGRTGRQPLGI